MREILTIPANDLRAQAIALKDQMEQSYRGLQKVLHEINRRKLWEHWQHKTLKRPYLSMQEYGEVELGIHQRKLQTFIQMEQRLGVEFAIDKKTERLLEQVGWAKQREIAMVANKENVFEWAKRAAEMSLRELHQATRGKEPLVEGFKRYVFVLATSAAKVVDRAFAKAKRETDCDNTNRLFELICADYDAG